MRGEEVAQAVGDPGTVMPVAVAVAVGVRMRVRVRVVMPCSREVGMFVVLVAHVVPLPVGGATPAGLGRDGPSGPVAPGRAGPHYVRMSARMHLSPAHSAHEHTPGAPLPAHQQAPGPSHPAHEPTPNPSHPAHEPTPSPSHPAHQQAPDPGRPAYPHPHPPSEEQFALAADLLALLADRTRLALLRRLSEGEADVTTLTEVCGAARPAVSQHLAKLRLAGLVGARKEGRRVVYALHDGRLRRIVDEALDLATHQRPDGSSSAPAQDSVRTTSRT